MAEKGHEVTCIDINKEKIDMLRSGHSPIYENGLEELMQKNKEKLHFTLDSKEAYQNAEVIFIGVGTPEKRDGSANLKYINEVVDQISEIVQQECVVVVKSTVPIGTNDKIEKKLKSKNTKIDVVSNPEFLAQGTAVHDTLCASRIVIGSENKRAKEIMLKVYEKFDAPFVLTNRRSAEMIKSARDIILELAVSF